jgi:hypothetical protein
MMVLNKLAVRHFHFVVSSLDYSGFHFLTLLSVCGVKPRWWFPSYGYCLCCSKPILLKGWFVKAKVGRRRQFCGDACRMRYNRSLEKTEVFISGLVSSSSS